MLFTAVAVTIVVVVVVVVRLPSSQYVCLTEID